MYAPLPLQQCPEIELCMLAQWGLKKIWNHISISMSHHFHKVLFAWLGQQSVDSNHLSGYKYNNLRHNTLFCWLLGQMSRRPSVWCSKHYLFFISYRLRAHKSIYMKNKLKGFLQRILQDIMKKRITLGTSDAWSTSHFSQQNSLLYSRLSDFIYWPVSVDLRVSRI